MGEKRCGTGTCVPTVPLTSTRLALRNFFSMFWTWGSSTVRPMRRLREPMVFLKLDVSWVLADSPMERCLTPNATRDL
jgi:hypothetical protein